MRRAAAPSDAPSPRRRRSRAPRRRASPSCRGGRRRSIRCSADLAQSRLLARDAVHLVARLRQASSPPIACASACRSCAPRCKQVTGEDLAVEIIVGPGRRTSPATENSDRGRSSARSTRTASSAARKRSSTRRARRSTSASAAPGRIPSSTTWRRTHERARRRWWRGWRRRRRRIPGGFDLGAMMQQAQQLQEQMMKAQEEAKQKTVEASAGGGMVTVDDHRRLRGARRSRSIPQCIDPKDPSACCRT